MFSDSCVKSVYPYRLIETNTCIPDKIFPVFIGSGKCIMSLDSLGMQSLNNHIQKAYNCFQNAGDMYIVKNGMVGDALSPHNTLPLGRLGYSIEIDGEYFDSEKLLETSAMFRRENDILRAQVKTSFIVASKVCVEILAYIPYGTESPIFKFRFKNYSDCIPFIKDEHNVKINLAFNLKTWQDKDIYDNIEFKDGKVVAVANGHEGYENSFAFSSNGKLSVELVKDVLNASFEVTAGEDWSKEQTVMLSFDGLKVEEETTLEKVHLSSWEDYYANSAFVKSDNKIMDFLYRNSLYLLKLGFEPEKGYPIGHPFNFPACWQSCNFWDAHFTMDALMRSGNVKNAEIYLKLLKRIMREEGRPFPWMFIYDGTTFLDDSHDIAPLVISAHAMSAIRYFEYFRDEKVLKETIYPILKRCAYFAKENMFAKRKDGMWEVSLAVSNDVVDDEGTEVNQTYTAVWFAVIFKKTAEYAKLLGENNDTVFEEIADNIYIDKNDEEYMHCRGYTAEEFGAASWVPFLYYPAESEPFLERELVLKTIEKYTFVELYKQKQNCYQPWTECIEAQSHHRAGLQNEAYKLLETAIEHTFGNGYFSEIGPHMQTVNLPPYLSPHSTFISTYLDTFASSSLWEKRAELFINMPDKLLNGRCEMGRVYGAGNYYVEYAEYTTQGVTAFLKCRKGTILKVRLPLELKEDDIRLFIDGNNVNCSINYRKRYIETMINTDKTIKLEIR